MRLTFRHGGLGVAGLRGGPIRPRPARPDRGNAGGGMAHSTGEPAAPRPRGGFMSQKTIVLANATLDDPETLRKRLMAWGGAEGIGAHGGARLAARLGLQPEIVIGDLDSLDPQDRQALAQAGVRLQASPADKDETDLELALRLAVAGGAQQVAVLR